MTLSRSTAVSIATRKEINEENRHRQTAQRSDSKSRAQQEEAVVESSERKVRGVKRE